MKRRKFLLRIINYWPPYLGAGIHVTKIAPDLTFVEVQMKLHFWNKNYVGTHFGGSLYSMTDPFFMLMLIENLGPKYEVWDKKGEIRYVKPGRGTVRAFFQLSQEDIQSIKWQVESEEKAEKTFQVTIYDESNNVVAVVDKTLHIKQKWIK